MGEFRGFSGRNPTFSGLKTEPPQGDFVPLLLRLQSRGKAGETHNKKVWKTNSNRAIAQAWATLNAC